MSPARPYRNTFCMVRAAAVVVLVVFANLLAAAPALAAKASPANRAVVAVVETLVAGQTGTVAFKVNRAPKQVTSITCSLDSAAVSCGAVIVAERKATKYSATLAGLPAGTHVFRVDVILTDGGAATASTSFAVVAPEPEPSDGSRAACAAVPGAYAIGGLGVQWTCTYYNFTGADPDDRLVAVCSTSSNVIATSLDGAEAVQHACLRAEAAATEEICRSVPVGRFLLDLVGSFGCVHLSSAGAEFATRLTSQCDALGGVSSTEARDTVRIYWCRAAAA